MSSLSLLKQKSCTKQYISFDKLPIGNYIVSNFTLVKTSYGSRLRVDIGDNVICLPQRYADDVTPEIVASFNDKPKLMIFKGKDPKYRNM